MFRRRIKLSDDIQNFENLSSEQIEYFYIRVISRGDLYFYKELLLKKSVEKSSLLEQAIAYGRFIILEQMLTQDYYKKLLLTNYNPFLFDNCNPDVTSDIYDDEYWSNDEHERSLVNKRGIDHVKCFEMLYKYSKKLNSINCLKFFILSTNQLKYSNGIYFPSYQILINEILYNDNIEVNVKNTINFLQEIGQKDKQMNSKLMLKVVSNVFNTDDIIEKLKM